MLDLVPRIIAESTRCVDRALRSEENAEVFHVKREASTASVNGDAMSVRRAMSDLPHVQLAIRIGGHDLKAAATGFGSQLAKSWLSSP